MAEMDNQWRDEFDPARKTKGHGMGSCCVCGHCEEAHGHDPEYPGSTACQEDDCDCVAYEWDGEGDDDAGGDG